MSGLPLVVLWLILLGSIVSLYGASEVLVRGGAAVSERVGIKKVVIGLTVVAMGTSMPEFFVSLFGALKGSSDISVGNIIGSNLANLGLALAIAVLISKEVGNLSEVKWDLLLLNVITLIFLFFSLNGKLSRLNGLFLFIVLGFYIFASSKREGDIIIDERPIGYPLAMILIGIAILGLAGHYTVESGIEISKRMGISQLSMGMTAMAIGTSLPEIFVSVVAAIRKEGGIGIGNVIGSNIFNTLGVAGGVAIIKPLSVNSLFVKFFIPIYMIMLLFLLLLSLLRIKIVKITAGLILVVYFLLVLRLFK